MMKYRKKLAVCSLIGLTVLINSCLEKSPLQLIHSAELNFPSASAIEFHNNRLYVFGDDAPYLLVLNTAYEKIDSIHFWSKPGRIRKEDKHDIESAFIGKWNGELFLYGVRSMSAANRWGALHYSLDNNSLSNLYFFSKDYVIPKIKTVNIEGSCQVGDLVVFSNRANLSDSINHLIFFRNEDSIVVKPIYLPKTTIAAGISGLYYVKERDLLLLTASEEETKDAINDGAIGESYLGMIQSFSKKLKDEELKPDQFIKLADVDKAFTKQKVESVCMEKAEGNTLILHLVADNDNGMSNIFKIKLTL